MNLLVVNVPFLVTRLAVKYHHEKAILSVMTIKNVILSSAASRELYHVYVSFLSVGERREEQHNNNVIGEREML